MVIESCFGKLNHRQAFCMERKGGEAALSLQLSSFLRNKSREVELAETRLRLGFCKLNRPQADYLVIESGFGRLNHRVASNERSKLSNRVVVSVNSTTFNHDYIIIESGFGKLNHRQAFCMERNGGEAALTLQLSSFL
jgi:hypothetical protein